VKGGIAGDTLDGILRDWRSAPIDERMRATLTFLEKLTLRPLELGGTDADAARAAGVDDAALEEAVAVCFLFCTIDRIADALDFKLPTPRSLRWVGRILLRVGYGAASLPG
jgi:alkylhydroperoxidase family enzyme